MSTAHHKSSPSRTCACGCKQEVIIDGTGSALSRMHGEGDERERIYFSSNECLTLWSARHDELQLELPV